jgi:hypothetical protein
VSTLEAMLGEWIRQVPGPFGPKRPDLQLIRNRAIQEILASKALEAADEIVPGFGQAFGREQDPDVCDAFARFALEAAEAKWPGFRKLTRQLEIDEGGYWKRSGMVAA